MALDSQATAKALEIAWEMTKLACQNINIGGDLETKKETIKNLYSEMLMLVQSHLST